jgi:hypothetical protein
MRWEPVKDEHGAEWQMARFIEFCRLKRSVGEPSPHMTLVVHMMEGESEAERIWRIGCYTAAYSALTAEAIWREFPYTRAIRARGELTEWIKANWAGFHIRTERRMVRTPLKFIANLLSWMTWQMNEVPHLHRHREDSRRLYDEWYDSIMEHVLYHGRYITIRAVEGIRRATGIPLYLYDIRSIGGESPVRCLSLLYPDFEQRLLVDKDAKIAEVLGNSLLESVQQEVPGADHYMLAAMLCEYREAYEDRHQYPARTIDQELEYLNGPKAKHWEQKGFETGLWAARKAVVPAQALGEYNGWEGVRHDLSRWLRDRGENWSDHRYTYPDGQPRVL